MKTILVIDDQQDNLITIKAVLKNYLPNCEVLTALSGKEGIEIAQKAQPDTILLDIIMPNIDGYEVCKRLKEDKLTNHIPVVMLTAIKINSESRIKGLDIGAEAFLSKPIDPSELTAQVNAMLRIKAAEDKLRIDKANLEGVVLGRTKELIAINEKLKLENTERKQAEKELKKHQEQLEVIVKERTNELEVKNEKLQENVEELERYHQLFIDREFRIKELRDEIEELKKK